MRSLIAYMVGVSVTAIVCGLLLNQLYELFSWTLQLSMMEHAESYPLWRQLAAVLLAALLARVWLQPLFNRKPTLVEAA